MPDVFDEAAAAPAATGGDVFDQAAAASPVATHDVFDQVTNGDVVDRVAPSIIPRGNPNLVSTTAGGPQLRTAGAAGVGAQLAGEMRLPTGRELYDQLPDAETVGSVYKDVTRPAVAIPKLTVNADDSKTVAVGKEAVNIALGIPEFVESPAGIVSGGAGSILPRTVAAIFTADTLHNVGKGIVDTHKNWDGMTGAQKAAAVTDIVGNGVMAGLLAHASVKAPVELPPAGADEIEAALKAVPEPAATAATASETSPPPATDSNIPTPTVPQAEPATASTETPVPAAVPEPVQPVQTIGSVVPETDLASPSIDSPGQLVVNGRLQTPPDAVTPLNDLTGGVFRSPDGFIGTLAKDEAGRHVLDNGQQLFELPVEPAATIGESGLRPLSLNDAKPEEGQSYPAEPMPVLSKLQTGRNVAAFRNLTDTAKVAEAAARPVAPTDALKLPVMDPAAQALVDSVIKVATAGNNAELGLRYGALEAVPTAKRMLTGQITRLEQAGASAAATDPLYQKLLGMETFENKYLDTVTKPDAVKGKANSADVLGNWLNKADLQLQMRQNMLRKEGRLRALGDPEAAALWIGRGAIKIAKGTLDFSKWSAEMAAEAGEWIRPQLESIWNQAKQVIDGTHPTLGLSARGVNIHADTEISQPVKDYINPLYQRRTNEDAIKQGARIVVESGGAEQTAQAFKAGKFSGAPGDVQIATAAHAARLLAQMEQTARKAGRTGDADRLVELQRGLLTDTKQTLGTEAAQTLQANRIWYDHWSPAAWLKDFKDKVQTLAAARVKRVTGKEVEPTATGISKGIADKIAADLAKTHPRLGEAVRMTFGSGVNGKSLVDNIIGVHNISREEAVKTAKKIESLYEQQVWKFRKIHNIPAFDAVTERDILRRANALEALPEDSVQRRTGSIDLQNHLARLKGYDWHEMPLEIWYANILSGLTTAGKIFRSNAVTAAGETSLQMLRHPTAIPQIIEAWGRALPRSGPEMWRILKTGAGGREGDVFESGGPLENIQNPIGQKIAAPWKMVFRTHHALHALTYYPLQETKAVVLAREAGKAVGVPVWGGSLAQHARDAMAWGAEAKAQAVAQAVEEGLKAGTTIFKSRVAELLERQRPPLMMVNARDYAKLGTYINDSYGVLGAFGDSFQKLSQQYPGLKLIQPFVKIPLNLFNGTLNWTPVGVYRAGRAQGWKMLVGREAGTGKLFGKEVTDPTALGDQWARGLIGTAAIVGLTAAAGQYVKSANPPFMVTARGPDDPNQQKLLRATGWIPNSVKIGNSYINYQDLPASVGLAYVGNLMDALRYKKLDKEDMVNRAVFATAAIRNTVFDSSWAQGLSSLFAGSDHTSSAGAVRTAEMQAARTGTSFVVPNILRNLDQLFDQNHYKATEVEGMLMTQIPFVRASGQPDLNVFGEPVKSPLSQAFFSKVTGDDLVNTLAGRQLWPSVPLEPNLTAEQNYKFIQTRGPELRKELTAYLPTIKTAPQGQAEFMVRNISEMVTKAAMDSLGYGGINRAAKYDKMSAK